MNTIVIAPHPDDETLGVGGTLLRRKSEGCAIAWVVVTSITTSEGWPLDKVQKRVEELKKVAQFFQFDNVYELNLPSTRLDQIPVESLVEKISDIFEKFKPNEVFIPHVGDVHTDHQLVFSAVASCVKWFRYPHIKRILSYETVSETGFGLNPNEYFRPNFYVNIESQFDEKLRAVAIYASELGLHPFPRSYDSIRALATLRGSEAGCQFAEAFQLLKEIT